MTVRMTDTFHGKCNNRLSPRKVIFVAILVTITVWKQTNLEFVIVEIMCAVSS